MQKTIKLAVNGTELAFDVTTELYNKYINEMCPNNKVAPAHNFAMRCVAGRIAGRPEKPSGASRRVHPDRGRAC